MSIAFVLVAFVLIFLCGEGLLRAHILDREMARKCTHLMSGIFTMMTPRLVSYPSIVWIAGFFAAALFILQGNSLLGSITVSERKTNGSWLMPLGISLTAWLFPFDSLFLPAVAVLTFSDTAAGIVGRKSAHKTMKGSAAFFLVTLCILLIDLSLHGAMTPSSFFVTLALALLLTLVERMTSFGLDNLFLPLVTASCLLIFP